MQGIRSDRFRSGDARKPFTIPDLVIGYVTGFFKDFSLVLRAETGYLGPIRFAPLVGIDAFIFALVPSKLSWLRKMC
jgi:hypothetical protein